MAGMAFSDLGRVHWLSTLKVALARGFFAGLIWTVILYFDQITSPDSALTIISMPFLWALIAIPMALFVQGLGWIGGMFIPLFGLFCTVIGSSMVCVGDPFVYILNRFFPALLNVTDFKIMNFAPVMFILHPE